MKTWRPNTMLVLLMLGLVAPTAAHASFVDWLGAEDELVEMGGTRVVSLPMLRIPQGETAAGDVYAIVNQAMVSGDVSGDLSIVAQEIDIAGRIAADANLAAFALSVSGEIGDDLRAAALGEITLDGIVRGDAFIAGGKRVALGGETRVMGALAISAAEVVIKGRISGPVRVTAGLVELDGELGAGARIECDELRIGPSGRVIGDLVYDARSEIVAPEGFATGQVIKTDLKKPEDGSQDIFKDVKLPDFGIWLDIYLAFVAIFGGVVFLLFFRPLADGAIAMTATGSGLGASFGIGLVAVLVMLVLGVMCLLVVLPFALAVWAALGALVYFGGLIGKMIVGCLIMRPIVKRQCHALAALFVGVVAMFLIGLVPVVDDIVWIVVTLTGMGATMLQLRDARLGDHAGEPAQRPTGDAGPPPPPRVGAA